ncbi:Uncharacterised protein [uncultured archaeon]|nr:Uncharacterised protein [uncultured archaeon]
MSKPTIYPIPIYPADVENKELTTNITLRKLTDVEKLHFFGIENAKYDPNGILSGFDVRRTTLSKEIGFLLDKNYEPDVNLKYKFLSAQYCIEITDGELANLFYMGMKLLFPEKMGLIVGIKEGERGYEYGYGIHYINPISTGIRNSIPDWKLRDIEQAVTIFSKIERLKNDDKLQIIRDKYLYAVSDENIKRENRFIDLVTILEMLYLPNEGIELGYRLKIRIAKVFKKFQNRNATEVFKNVGKIYGVRSGLVHNGKHTETGKWYPILLEYARESIKIYLDNQKAFNENELDVISLE